MTSYYVMFDAFPYEVDTFIDLTEQEELDFTNEDIKAKALQRLMNTISSAPCSLEATTESNDNRFSEEYFKPSKRRSVDHREQFATNNIF